MPGSFNGQVRDISVTGNRLWIAGKFTHVHGHVAAGARDPQRDHRSPRPLLQRRRRLERTGTGTVTNVLQITTNPANNRLIAIGNFTTVNGLFREQIFMLDIGGAVVLARELVHHALRVGLLGQLRDLHDRRRVLARRQLLRGLTTGAYGGATGSIAGTSGCDVVARFESNGTGTNVRPTWTNYTGGDTTWSVEVTNNVVYVGGHQRWQNNPTRGDAAGQGAVSRPGIAALNTLNGMPYSWNPTRTRGVGVKDMIATPEGLFVGSDTDTIGGETHRKVAFLPLASGDDAGPDRSVHAARRHLPRCDRAVAAAAQGLRRHPGDLQLRTRPTAPAGAPPSAPSWSTACSTRRTATAR